MIIGACGQLGSELTTALGEKFGADQILATDLRHPDTEWDGIQFEILNALDRKGMEASIRTFKPTQIYLLAAMLSAKGEENPQLAWQLNMESLLHVLELAVEYKIPKVYWPSSIAAFGPCTPKIDTAQDTIMDPGTIYGISKLAGERWCAYYFNRYGLDVRSLRYPGLISHRTLPGGGTTDYAVDIFYKALESKRFISFLDKDTRLPMMYMDDAVRATIELMDAPSDHITVRSSYNLSGIDFTPEELANQIQKHIPDFEISYKPDFRQKIADSWPAKIKDTPAREDWGWKPNYSLEKMVTEMLSQLSLKLGISV